MNPRQTISRGCVIPMLFVVVSACGTSRHAVVDGQDLRPPHETLNAVVWMQQSAEYEAAARQAYAAAQLELNEALADSTRSALPSRGLAYPGAVILDVDETVLDNSPYQARLVRVDAMFERDSWNAWVREEVARPVPGALGFTRAAAAAGVQVFYVTNRSADLELATRNNLVAAGFPVSDAEDVILTRGERPEWSGDKASRREYVQSRYRVLVLVGDDLNDFVTADRATREERAALVEENADRWGRSWILLPNPIYGSWERLVNRDAGARTRDEQIEAKSQVLEVR